MGERMDNFKVVSSNPRARMAMITVGALVIGVIAVGVMSLGSDENQPAEVAASAEAAGAPIVDSVPGTSTDPTYTGLQDQANAANAAQAEAAGGSSVPMLTGGDQVAPDVDPLDIPTNAAPQTPPQELNQLPPAPAVQPAPVEPTPAPAPVEPVVATPPPVASERMIRQVEGYLNKWGPRFKGAQEFNYIGARLEPSQAEATAAAAQAASAAGVGAATNVDKPTFVRAGTVVPAVLLTPINSDRPGPVLAQITTGPLAGSRLIGQFQASEHAVAVVFTTITNPAWETSYKINAFAVDQNTSPGLVTDVNRHSFRRYGLQLAGAFIAGMGQAITQSNQRTIIGPGGVVIQEPQRQLSNRDIAKVAAGEVGQNIAQDAEQRGDLAPTITVKGQGGQPYPIGLLFLENF